MNDQVIEGSVVEEDTASEEQQVAHPKFPFSERAVQSTDQLRAKVQERIKAHEDQLTEEELSLWEQTIMGNDTTEIAEQVANRKALISIYVQQHNDYFEPQTDESKEESR